MAMTRVEILMSQIRWVVAVMLAAGCTGGQSQIRPDNKSSTPADAVSLASAAPATRVARPAGTVVAPASVPTPAPAAVVVPTPPPPAAAPVAPVAPVVDNGEMKKVLERMQALEEQNKTLLDALTKASERKAEPTPAPVPSQNSSEGEEQPKKKRKTTRLTRKDIYVPGNIVASDRTSGATPAFFRGERFPVAYIGSWPTNVPKTDNVQMIKMQLGPRDYILEPKVGGRKMLVALPTLVGDASVLTDEFGNVSFSTFEGTTDIEVIGADDSTIPVSQQPDGTYHVTVRVPGMTGKLTLQMAIADDGVKGAAPRLACVILTMQKAYSELKQGVMVSGYGYTKYSDASMPIEKEKDCGERRVSTGPLIMCG